MKQPTAFYPEPPAIHAVLVSQALGVTQSESFTGLEEANFLSGPTHSDSTWGNSE